jgi:hypothetical protein
MKPAHASAPAVVVLWMLATGGCCLAEDLRVRLIDTRNGEPMKGQRIVVYLGSVVDGVPTPPVRWGTTGPDGTAVLNLPAPTVEWITIGDASGTLYHCSPFRESAFSTAQVFRDGGVAPNQCRLSRKLKEAIKAKPGEVILFARPLRWWEKGQW